MSIYNDKSREEIEANLQTFIDNYKKRTGLEPDLRQIKEKITKELKDKEEKLFSSTFGAYTPASLKIACDIIEEMNSLINHPAKPSPTNEQKTYGNGSIDNKAKQSKFWKKS